MEKLKQVETRADGIEVGDDLTPFIPGGIVASVVTSYDEEVEQLVTEVTTKEGFVTLYAAGFIVVVLRGER